ncbi:MAG: hypothetical protein ACRCXC_12150 [Legionella sp.]
MIAALQQTENFNSQVFLDRVYRVLRHCEKGMTKREVQQYILDNVDQIDWRHNGFYYAARYENHPYLSKGLTLSRFATSINQYNPSYVPQIDNPLRPMHPQEFLTNGRRYLGQRMKILFADFHKLNLIIDEEFEANRLIDSANGQQSFRLLLACFSQGTDRVSELDAELIREQLTLLKVTDQKLLQWINENILLDGEIIGSTPIKGAL